MPAELKLLGLYVMDSIIKNLKDTNYIQMFQENIVKIFANVFECVRVFLCVCDFFLLIS